jgi:transcriptional regulator with XRE-family HTH domain
MDYRTRIGNAVKQRRELANLTQWDLAKGLGYTSPQIISNIERGVALPPLSRAKKMCRLLGLSKRQTIFMQMLFTDCYKEKVRKAFQ